MAAISVQYAAAALAAVETGAHAWLACIRVRKPHACSEVPPQAGVAYPGIACTGEAAQPPACVRMKQMASIIGKSAVPFPLPSEDGILANALRDIVKLR